MAKFQAPVYKSSELPWLQNSGQRAVCEWQFLSPCNYTRYGQTAENPAHAQNCNTPNIQSSLNYPMVTQGEMDLTFEGVSDGASDI